MNKENCALKLVDEIILYYDARSIKHQTVTVTEGQRTGLFICSSVLCLPGSDAVQFGTWVLKLRRKYSLHPQGLLFMVAT